MVSGGFRPKASQNNPMSVSGNGGNGQAGDKAQKAMQLRPSGGGQYGATTALTRQIEQGGGVKTTAPAVANATARPLRIPASELSPMGMITDPTTRQEEDVTTGSLASPTGMMTPGPEALTLPGGGQGDAKFAANMNAYYSVLAYISGREDTSEDTRQVINTLMRAI